MFAKSIYSTLTVIGALTLLIAAGSVRPGLAKSGGGQLEGTWAVTVSFDSPPPGFPDAFTALETYSRGGGLITSNNLPVPVVPKVGQGAWEKNGNQYSVAILFFTFDENGVHNGSIHVRHRITLEGKDAYSGEGEAEFRDVNGNPLFTLPF
ncbi:MAG TPA: hypothetical protein VNO70_19985, partial [Blastocatellia bacterium]|nr:hypothetical protein [Blastocatellia bacterium]